jgi:Tol biopolymer transport system component
MAAEWIGLSANRIVYTVPHRIAHVWSIPVSGALAGLRMDSATAGNQLVETISVSRDGKWLVYDSNVNGNADIYRVSTSGGSRQHLTNDKGPEYSPVISPNDSELVWHRWKGPERRIFVRAIDGDSEVEVFTEKGDKGTPQWSPDGNAIAGWDHLTTDGRIFVSRRDASAKWSKPRWLTVGQLPAWAPDGKTIAFLKYDGSIETIPVDSGARKVVYAPRAGADDPIAIYIAWSTSPDSLWFLARDKAGWGSIWSLKLTTGKKKQLARFHDPRKLIGLMLGTDQRRFYFTLDERSSNVSWAELVKR